MKIRVASPTPPPGNRLWHVVVLEPSLSIFWEREEWHEAIIFQLIDDYGRLQAWPWSSLTRDKPSLTVQCPRQKNTRLIWTCRYPVGIIRKERKNRIFPIFLVFCFLFLASVTSNHWSWAPPRRKILKYQLKGSGQPLHNPARALVSSQPFFTWFSSPGNVCFQQNILDQFMREKCHQRTQLSWQSRAGVHCLAWPWCTLKHTARKESSLR